MHPWAFSLDTNLSALPSTGIPLNVKLFCAKEGIAQKSTSRANNIFFITVMQIWLKSSHYYP